MSGDRREKGRLRGLSTPSGDGARAVARCSRSSNCRSWSAAGVVPFIFTFSYGAPSSRSWPSSRLPPTWGGRARSRACNSLAWPAPGRGRRPSAGSLSASASARPSRPGGHARAGLALAVRRGVGAAVGQVCCWVCSRWRYQCRSIIYITRCSTAGAGRRSRRRRAASRSPAPFGPRDRVRNRGLAWRPTMLAFGVASEWRLRSPRSRF